MIDRSKLLKYIQYNEQDNHFSMSIENMAIMKTELIWLYNYLEIKGQESEQRGKPMSKEYKQSIETVKRASMFITRYSEHLELLGDNISELKRQNEYLSSQLPHVSLKDTTVIYENGRLKLIKKDLNVNME